MLGLTRQFNRSFAHNFTKKHMVRYYRGGHPGCNLPFRLDNPVRFTILFTIFGVTGFGASWIIIMHQMLRPYDYD
uniref:Uncharacterized protein n=1 Tax=Glossina pallidipes TaxID=7398 RepID=A0A1A9ZX19_GLOPL